jgi:hypothetical protein
VYAEGGHCTSFPKVDALAVAWQEEGGASCVKNYILPPTHPQSQALREGGVDGVEEGLALKGRRLPLPERLGSLGGQSLKIFASSTSLPGGNKVDCLPPDLTF